ncbi:MAG: HAD family phosphatase [Candidatus Acidiferrales bacterium]|jgi:putative hydrolase of the HAD superfamily
MPVNGHIPAGKLTEIRAVILDYGEVLCHTPSTATIERLAAMFQMDPRTFLPIYLQTRVAYDRGDLLSSEYWQQFATQAGVRVGADAIEQAGQLDLELWSDLNDAMILWVQQLHAAGFKTAILSNMPADMATHMRKNFAWLSHFDHHIFSGEVRSVKPEPAIYQHCIDALGVRPLEALFIDDREINLEQARAVGIHTIRFQSVDQLRADLQALEFTILPGQAEVRRTVS